MLHILLLILKIVGLVLAALLGLVLILLLILLFVPFRYRVYVSRKGEWLVRGKVTWLLRILSFPLVFEKGEFSAKLKVFGLTVKDFTGNEEELEEEADAFFREAEDSAKEEAEELFAEEPSGETGQMPDRDQTAARQREEEDTREAGLEEEKETLPGTGKKNFFVRISKKIRNLKYTIRRFCVKIKRGIRKIRETKAFLTDERTRLAVTAVLRELRVLLKALLPRKIRGEVHFGMEDPALTGEILGGIGIFYPVFMDNVKVFPDFEESVLEGELFAKGRLRLVTVTGIALRLLMDKNVR